MCLLFSDLMILISTMFMISIIGATVIILTTVMNYCDQYMGIRSLGQCPEFRAWRPKVFKLDVKFFMTPKSAERTS